MGATAGLRTAAFRWPADLVFVAKPDGMPVQVDICPKLLVKRVPPERLEFCSQTAESSDPEFCPGSVVPGARWTPATAVDGANETSWMSFGEGVPLLHNVALIRMPPGLLDGHLLTNVEWRDSEARRSDLKARVDEVCRVLTSTPAAMRHRGTFHGVPGKTSACTTRHPSSRRLVGLHIDMIDSEPIAVADRAMNRLCVNLGPGRRWFVFMPVALQSVVAACRLREADVLTSEHFRHFLHGRTAPLVYRISVEPGDAYIAPTQILLHDGQSDSQDGQHLYTVVGPFDQTAQVRDMSVI
jgi:hypothetical protein